MSLLLIIDSKKKGKFNVLPNKPKDRFNTSSTVQLHYWNKGLITRNPFSFAELPFGPTIYYIRLGVITS